MRWAALAAPLAALATDSSTRSPVARSTSVRSGNEGSWPSRARRAGTASRVRSRRHPRTRFGGRLRPGGRSGSAGVGPIGQTRGRRIPSRHARRRGAESVAPSHSRPRAQRRCARPHRRPDHRARRRRPAPGCSAAVDRGADRCGRRLHGPTSRSTRHRRSPMWCVVPETYRDLHGADQDLDFSLVGVTWDAVQPTPILAEDLLVAVRTRSEGTWQPWTDARHRLRRRPRRGRGSGAGRRRRRRSAALRASGPHHCSPVHPTASRSASTACPASCPWGCVLTSSTRAGLTQTPGSWRRLRVPPMPPRGIRPSSRVPSGALTSRCATVRPPTSRVSGSPSCTTPRRRTVHEGPGGCGRAVHLRLRHEQPWLVRHRLQRAGRQVRPDLRGPRRGAGQGSPLGSHRWLQRRVLVGVSARELRRPGTLDRTRRIDLVHLGLEARHQPPRSRREARAHRSQRLRDHLEVRRWHERQLRRDLRAPRRGLDRLPRHQALRPPASDPIVRRQSHGRPALQPDRHHRSSCPRATPRRCA